MNEPDWNQATCGTATDAELFFPTLGLGKRNPRTAEAKAYCAACPIRTDCLQWAITNHEVGIWGGMTDRERVIHRNGGRLRDRYRQKDREAS